MLIFTILLDGFYRYFHTHKTDDSNDASTSFFLLFSLLLVFLRLLLHWVFLDLRDDWTSGLLFFYCTEIFLDLRKENFCSLFLLLWLSWGHSIGFFAKRGLLERILWKLKLAAARFETSTLITFYHWKNFRRCRGLNPGLHSLSCLWCIYCKEHWCRHEN